MLSTRRLLAMFGVVLGLVMLVVVAAPQWRAAASPAAQPAGYYSFSVKFVCGKQGNFEPQVASVRPGFYATEINIHNYNNREVSIRKYFTPLVIYEDAIGREPRYSEIRARDGIVLPPRTATMDDCQRITELLGLPADAHVIGFMELESTHDLSVDAVYTVQGFGNTPDTAIEVERVEGKFVSF